MQKGNKVYDDPQFFDKYLEKRNRSNSPNQILEEPIIDQLLGNVGGMNLLDLGCGDGQYGLKLLRRGLTFYHGVDASANMIGQAQQHLKGQPHLLAQMPLEGIDLPKQQFDLVLSRLVFHYLEDVRPLFLQIHQSLKPKGQFIFSVEHPIITSCYDAYHKNQKRQSWIVDNYFNSGKRINHWIEKDVLKYHRTLEEYFSLFKETGFRVNDLRESKPDATLFDDPSNYERRMRIPLFLIFRLIGS